MVHDRPAMMRLRWPIRTALDETPRMSYHACHLQSSLEENEMKRLLAFVLLFALLCAVVYGKPSPSPDKPGATLSVWYPNPEEPLRDRMGHGRFHTKR